MFIVAFAAPTGVVGPYFSKYELKSHIVPDAVGTIGVVAGLVGVKISVDTTVCPLIIVVKVKGVGAPGAAVVGAGWPTGPCGLIGDVVVVVVMDVCKVCVVVCEVCVVTCVVKVDLHISCYTKNPEL